MQSTNTNRTRAGARRAGGGVVPHPASRRDARVLIVDDHPAVRNGLQALIAAEPGLQPVAAVGDAASAIAAYENLRPEMAVVDYHLGRRDGLSLCLALKQFRRSPQVLIFSAFVDDYLTIASIIAGADGVLSKTALGHELCAVLRTLVRGGRVRAPVKRDAIEAIGMSLEPQDIPVLGMLVNEVASDDVAAALNTSEQWVAARRSAMLKRLVRRRATEAPDHSTAIAGGRGGMIEISRS